MSETCAVCRQGRGPGKCEVCGFSDNGSINRQFPIPEDTQNWIDTVVKPYRIQWEAKKRDAELLKQLEEARRKEAELKVQLEESKKNVQVLTPPPASPAPVSPPKQENYSYDFTDKTTDKKDDNKPEKKKSVFKVIFEFFEEFSPLLGAGILGSFSGWLFKGITGLIVGSVVAEMFMGVLSGFFFEGIKSVISGILTGIIVGGIFGVVSWFEFEVNILFAFKGINWIYLWAVVGGVFGAVVGGVTRAIITIINNRKR